MLLLVVPEGRRGVRLVGLGPGGEEQRACRPEMEPS